MKGVRSVNPTDTVWFSFVILNMIRNSLPMISQTAAPPMINPKNSIPACRKTKLAPPTAAIAK